MINVKNLVKFFDKDCLLVEHGGTQRTNYDEPHTEDRMFYYDQFGQQQKKVGEDVVSGMSI